MFNAIKVNYILRQLTGNTRSTSRSADTIANLGGPIGNIFFRKDVRRLLDRIVKIPKEKAILPRREGRPFKPPQYKFMTNEELKRAEELSAERAKKHWLQMPPVLDPYVPEPKIIEKDSALDGHNEENALFVFTDISFGIPEQERIVVIREPNGLLRLAEHTRSRRINQIYSPRPGRELEPPPMFEEPHFGSLLNRDEHAFVLDRACAQFEPDDPDFVSVCSRVFQHVSDYSKFHLLCETRHFGPCVLRLVAADNIDGLLAYLIDNDKLNESEDVLTLHRLIKNDDKKTDLEGNSKLLLLEEYVKNKPHLKLSLTMARTRLKEALQIPRNLDQAHGVS